MCVGVIFEWYILLLLLFRYRCVCGCKWSHSIKTRSTKPIRIRWKILSAPLLWGVLSNVWYKSKRGNQSFCQRLLYVNGKLQSINPSRYISTSSSTPVSFWNNFFLILILFQFIIQPMSLIVQILMIGSMKIVLDEGVITENWLWLVVNF